MVGKAAEICQSSAAYDGAILQEGTEGEADLRCPRQSQFVDWNGFNCAQCCVPYGYITTDIFLESQMGRWPGRLRLSRTNKKGG
ncbi:hypothetical protein QQF64_004889 [Cirrhinus molitorella]|uniref:Uncharacterized protein n=1 Tax=Cirrhinus molitorella TaxID=172907 RepID=A0ABR3MK64_9TELE